MFWTFFQGSVDWEVFLELELQKMRSLPRKNFGKTLFRLFRCAQCNKAQTLKEKPTVTLVLTCVDPPIRLSSVERVVVWQTVIPVDLRRLFTSHSDQENGLLTLRLRHYVSNGFGCFVLFKLQWFTGRPRELHVTCPTPPSKYILLHVLSIIS